MKRLLVLVAILSCLGSGAAVSAERPSDFELLLLIDGLLPDGATPFAYWDPRAPVEERRERTGKFWQAGAEETFERCDDTVLDGIPFGGALVIGYWGGPGIRQFIRTADAAGDIFVPSRPDL